MKGDSNRRSQTATSSIRRFALQGFPAIPPSMNAQLKLHGLNSHLSFQAHKVLPSLLVFLTKFQFSRCFNVNRDCDEPNSAHNSLKLPEAKH